MRRLSFIAGAAYCGLALPLGANAAEVKVPKPHVHGPNGVTTIPANRAVEWTMEVLDGPRFRLSAYRGKVVFCTVFATWCAPCRMEQPDLGTLARAHPDDTALIAIDIGEEDNTVRGYRKEFEIAYPIAMHRERGSVPGVFVKGVAYPTTIVFGPEGTLSCAFQGNRSLAWFEAERTYALGEPAETPATPKETPAA
jgi:thiol-disulfide isomerase/thioredoxin